MTTVAVPYRDPTVVVDPPAAGTTPNPVTGRIPPGAGTRLRHRELGYFRRSALNLRGLEQPVAGGVSEATEAQVLYPAGTVVDRAAEVLTGAPDDLAAALAVGAPLDRVERWSIVGTPREGLDRYGVPSYLVVNLRLTRDLQDDTTE